MKSKQVYSSQKKIWLDSFKFQSFLSRHPASMRHVIPAEPSPSFYLSLDDPVVIDTDSDLDEAEEDAEKDSGQQISDCESESSGEKPQESSPKPANVSELLIF